MMGHGKGFGNWHEGLFTDLVCQGEGTNLAHVRCSICICCMHARTSWGAQALIPALLLDILGKIPCPCLALVTSFVKLERGKLCVF